MVPASWPSAASRSLAVEIALHHHHLLVELFELVLLAGQLGGGLLDLAGQLGVEVADLRDHPVEAAREHRQLVAAALGRGHRDVELALLDGAHRGLEHADAAHQDPAHHQPERERQEQRRAQGDAQERRALRHGDARGLLQRRRQGEARPAAAAVGEGLRRSKSARPCSSSTGLDDGRPPSQLTGPRQRWKSVVSPLA